MLLLFAAALPSLIWDAPPDTAPVLRDAGIDRILVPASQYDAWKKAALLKVEAADVQGMVKLLAPGVQYRANVASATATPWLTTNGWRILRNPQARFCYDV